MSTNRRIRKAVFPVAGLGTRFLPATKALPKEMLPIVDRPLIQIVVDEAKAAGIEHFIFVTGRNKSIIEDHFDKQFELEATLLQRGRLDDLAILEQDLPSAGQTSFTRQQIPMGLGHAIWCARHLVGDEPFAVLLPDMLMHAKPGCLQQLMDVYQERNGGNVIAVETAENNILHRYGVVGAEDWSNNNFRVNQMVEKPINNPPSNLIISGRYLLQPEIFEELEKHQIGTAGEVQITDAMNNLLRRQPFYGVQYEGTTYDCGNKIGYFEAIVAHALDNQLLGLDMQQALTRAVEARGGRLSWEAEDTRLDPQLNASTIAIHSQASK